MLTRLCILASVLCLLELLLLYLGVMIVLHGEVTLRPISHLDGVFDVAIPGILIGWTLATIILLFKGGKPWVK